MIDMKDDISGTGTDYPVEVQVQYSTDSLSTMPSQSVTKTNFTAKAWFSQPIVLATIYTRNHTTMYNQCWFETWQGKNKYYK
jgi:hypothetical protein